MKNNSLRNVLIIALAMAMFSACGGDKKGAPVPTLPAPQPSGPTTAVIRIAIAGTLDPGTMIGGITITAVLPAGVTVKATPDAQNPAILVTDSGVVTASGAAVSDATGENASSFGTYDSTDRKVSIQVYDQDGFETGEFVTVRCAIASGSAPTAANFGLEAFTPKDLNGTDINGLTPGYTVQVL